MHTPATRRFLRNSIRWAPTLTQKIPTLQIQTTADAEREARCIPATETSAIPRAIVHWMECITRVIWPTAYSNRVQHLLDLKIRQGTTIRNNDLSSSEHLLTVIAVSYQQTLCMPAAEGRLVFRISTTLL